MKKIKIYTSYFGNLKNISEGFIPVTICGKVPDGYNGLQYKKLAPKYDFFVEWKKNHDNDYYIKCFNEQVLKELDVQQVCDDLYNMAEEFVNSLPDDDMRKINQRIGFSYPIVLICYEKPEDFCHRQLVSNWFNENNISCEEYDNKKFDWKAKFFDWKEKISKEK